MRRCDCTNTHPARAPPPLFDRGVLPGHRRHTGSVPAVDLVLTASRPSLAAADALEVARSLFGVTASRARDLGSERDRTFALDDRTGRPVAILKVSNPSEDPAVLDME